MNEMTNVYYPEYSKIIDIVENGIKYMAWQKDSYSIYTLRNKKEIKPRRLWGEDLNAIAKMWNYNNDIPNEILNQIDILWKDDNKNQKTMNTWLLYPGK